MFWWKSVNFSILRIKIFPLNSWVFLPTCSRRNLLVSCSKFFFLLSMNRPGNILFNWICTGINILKAGNNSSPVLGPGGSRALTHPQDILDTFQRSHHHHQVPCLWAVAGWCQKGPESKIRPQFADISPLSKWNASWKIKHKTLGKAWKIKGSELPTREHHRWQGYKAPSSALSTVKTKGFPPSSKSVSKDSLRMLCPDSLQSPELQTLQSGHPKGTRDKELFGPPTAAWRSALSRAQGKDILLLFLSC